MRFLSVTIAALSFFAMPSIAAAQADAEQGKAWTPAQYCASIPDQCEILDVECKIWNVPLVDSPSGPDQQHPQFLCMTKFCNRISSASRRCACRPTFVTPRCS